MKVHIFYVLFINYALIPFFFEALFLSQTQVGEAINIDEYAPVAIPITSGNEKSLTAGTNTLTAIIVINVVSVVLIDLDIVCVKLLSATSIVGAVLIVL